MAEDNVTQLTEVAPRSKGGEPASCTDDALALSFVEHHSDLRFVADWGHWLRWDSKRWAKDNTLQVFDEVRKHLREHDNPNLNESRKRELSSAKTVSAVERLARSDRRTAATSDQWDADDWVINTPTGIVDLNTGGVSPHRLGACCTKITAAGPEGNCPMWRRFLAQVTGDDADLEAYLQRVVGYGATGSVREHVLFFLYGRGANGKGTFLNTITGVLHEYATTASMEVFTESFGDRHPTELAMLRMVRLVVAQETEEGRRWAESRIKP